ncbi:hypothetical protein F5Y09DRAFT_148217 [Xylaria sp. FL1042]|nr:hypothetical protein F5Y09DRAFT_148217 [Xylaria sp. FL1042]
MSLFFLFIIIFLFLKCLLLLLSTVPLLCHHPTALFDQWGRVEFSCIWIRCFRPRGRRVTVGAKGGKLSVFFLVRRPHTHIHTNSHTDTSHPRPPLKDEPKHGKPMSACHLITPGRTSLETNRRDNQYRPRAGFWLVTKLLVVAARSVVPPSPDISRRKGAESVCALDVIAALLYLTLHHTHHSSCHSLETASVRLSRYGMCKYLPMPQGMF